MIKPQGIPDYTMGPCPSDLKAKEEKRQRELAAEEDRVQLPASEEKDAKAPFLPRGWRYRTFKGDEKEEEASDEEADEDPEDDDEEEDEEDEDDPVFDPHNPNASVKVLLFHCIVCYIALMSSDVIVIVGGQC